MKTIRQNNPNKLNARLVGLVIGAIGSVASMGCSGSYLDQTEEPTPPRTEGRVTAEGYNKDGEGYITVTDSNGEETSYHVPPTTEGDK